MARKAALCSTISFLNHVHICRTCEMALNLRDALCWSFASPGGCTDQQCPQLHLEHAEQPICYRHITTVLGLWGRRKRPPCTGDCGQQHPAVAQIEASLLAALNRPPCAGWRLHTYMEPAAAAFEGAAGEPQQLSDRSFYLVPREMSGEHVDLVLRGTRPINCCVALDLVYDHLMGDGERRSLATQAALCHSLASQTENRRHVALAISSDSRVEAGDGSSLGHIHAAGVDTWEGVKWRSEDCEPLPLTALCDAGRMVYLSPEADEVLDEVADGFVYVIGGLVDRKVQYGASRSRAEELGIRAARLPLQENLPTALKGRSNVLDALNLTTVMQVLVEFAKCREWATAVSTVLASGAQRNLCGAQAKDAETNE